MTISCRTESASAYVSEAEIIATIDAERARIEAVQHGEEEYRTFLGWYEVGSAPIDHIEDEANRVQALADVMIVIGIGGSNRAAMAVYEALSSKTKGPTRLYFAGDSLSEQRLKEALELVRSRRVVINVIAKDFNTIEPGITFRILRDELERTYGPACAQRIVATGSGGAGQLQELCRKHGWTFLPFPSDVGGRFSVFTAVGLFPLAVAGIDVRALLSGGERMLTDLRSLTPAENPAVRYAVLRSLIRKRGIHVEALVTFEPALASFSRWWVQLFAETEGKCDQVLLPISFEYSQDLHAVGQFVQEGPRIILETFLDLMFCESGTPIIPTTIEDGFSYLDGNPFTLLNRTVYKAACSAHSDDGVPCIELTSTRALDEGSMGALFAFFLFSVYLSARLLGVHPFTQDGVEQYKRNMYALLQKPGFQPGQGRV